MRRNNLSKTRRSANLSWYTIDLHLHTPASSDYQEPSVTYLQILQTAESRGLHMIAFADHNTVAGFRQLRDEIAELELLERLNRLMPDERYRLDEYRRLQSKVVVLPGFEFTATFGFHILGIFPPETPVRDLEHLLLSLNVPRDQVDLGSAAVGATSDVLTAYRLIHEAGGLAIAAHANSTSGVAMRGFGFGGQTKIAFTQDPNLCALEVTDLDQKGRRTTMAFFSGIKPEYPRRMHCISGSDAHRLHRDPHNPKNFGVGDRATDVLIEEPTFEALRELFASSDFARIRPHVAGAAPAEFDHVQQAREEGASLIQAFHDSMQQRGGKLYAVISDVCAFANTNGGTVFIGASADPKQPPLGVPEAEQSVRELRTTLARMITPQLECSIDLADTRSKKVIRVIVPRGDDPPYAIDDNKIFVREEAETSLAVRDEIVQLVLRGQAAKASLAAQPAAPAVAAPAAAAGGPPLVRPEAAEAPAVAAPAAPAAPGLAPLGLAGTQLPPVVEVVGETVTPPAAVEPGRPLPAPRTGVEIAATEERDGVRYHTMRDLRNGSVVKNVTRTSARKLWHYAITAKESSALKPEAVFWQGDIGVWKRSHKGGAPRYDLVQRVGDQLRVYYGVTDDGIHGPWRRLLEVEERRRQPAVVPAGMPEDTPPAGVALAEAPLVEPQPAEAPAAEPRESGEAAAVAADAGPGSAAPGLTFEPAAELAEELPAAEVYPWETEAPEAAAQPEPPAPAEVAPRLEIPSTERLLPPAEPVAGLLAQPAPAAPAARKRAARKGTAKKTTAKQAAPAGKASRKRAKAEPSEPAIEPEAGLGMPAAPRRGRASKTPPAQTGGPARPRRSRRKASEGGEPGAPAAS